MTAEYRLTLEVLDDEGEPTRRYSTRGMNGLPLSEAQIGAIVYNTIFADERAPEYDPRVLTLNPVED